MKLKLRYRFEKKINLNTPLKLSIITVNLNNATGLRKTIESVVNQTFTDYEYLIIDGGSTDGSVEIIKEYAHKITYWVSEPDKGIYYAMNKGILQAKGDLIGIINSGDWYENFALDIVNSVFMINPAVQIFHGVLRIWDGNTIFKIQGVNSNFLPNGMIEHPACFVKKDVYEKIGLFDLNFQVSSDYEFMIRAYTKNCKFLFIDKIISNYVLGGISYTSPLSHIETLKIKQQYGFGELKNKSLLSEITVTFKHLIGLFLPKIIRELLMSIYSLACLLKNFISNIDQVINPKKIPIIINNFNKVTYLKRLITSLEKKGYTNIYIIDNASTYKPLLEYYLTCPYKIFYLEENNGHKALWKSSIINKFRKKFFVYTDPDLEVPDECPDDFMKLFLKSLLKYNKAQKIGFSLKIDDLADCYDYKQEVIQWESQFFKNKVCNLYKAEIDTTFALYRPYAKDEHTSNIISFRTAYPYEIKHLPWYEDSANLTEEEIFYLTNKKRNIGMWSSKTIPNIKLN